MPEGEPERDGLYAPPSSLQGGPKRAGKKKRKVAKADVSGWFDELLDAVDRGEREPALRRLAKAHAEDREEVEVIVEDAYQVIRLERRVAGMGWVFWLGGGMLLLAFAHGGLSLGGIAIIAWNAVRRDRMQREIRALRERYA